MIIKIDSGRTKGSMLRKLQGLTYSDSQIQ